MPDTLVTPELRQQYLGRASSTVTGEVRAEDVRRFCYAVDDLNPLYLDQEHARKTRFGGTIAPPMFLATGVPTRNDVPLSQMREDGVPLSGRPVVRIPGLNRVVAGGTELEMLRPVRPGDVLAAQTRVADIVEREGRTGKMVLVTTETTYTNQKGEKVATVRFTSIHR